MPRKPIAIDKERGRRLRDEVKNSGLSVADFASMVFMSEGAIRNIFSGNKNLTDELARQASSILGVRPAYLMNYDPYRTEGDITGHPYFPHLFRMYHRWQSRKMIDKYLKAYGISIVVNDELMPGLGDVSIDELSNHEDDLLNGLEVLSSSQKAYKIVNEKGEILGYCSMKKINLFYSQINSFIEFSFNALLDGRE